MLILDWDFERIVVAHFEPLESAAKPAAESALREASCSSSITNKKTTISDVIGGRSSAPPPLLQRARGSSPLHDCRPIAHLSLILRPLALTSDLGRDLDRLTGPETPATMIFQERVGETK